MKIGDVLTQDDEIFSGVDSSLTLVLPGGLGDFAIGELTQLLIATFETDREGLRRIAVQLVIGKIRANVDKEKALDTNFEIQTPTATAGVRGTLFGVFYDSSAKATLISVTRGSVFVEPVGAGLASALLSPGQEVEVLPKAISAPGPIGTAGARGWARSRFPPHT